MQSVQVMRQVEKKAKLGRQVSLERKVVLTAVWGGSVINLELALPAGRENRPQPGFSATEGALFKPEFQTLSSLWAHSDVQSNYVKLRLSFWCFLDLFIISSKLTFGLSFTSDKGQCKGQTSRRTLCVLDGSSRGSTHHLPVTYFLKSKKFCIFAIGNKTLVRHTCLHTVTSWLRWVSREVAVPESQ